MFENANSCSKHSVCQMPKCCWGNAHHKRNRKPNVNPGPVSKQLSLPGLRFMRGASCFKVLPCSLSLCFYIHFSIVITTLGKEGAGLYVLLVHLFVCFARVCPFLLFLLVSGVGCSL